MSLGNAGTKHSWKACWRRIANDGFPSVSTISRTAVNANMHHACPPLLHDTTILFEASASSCCAGNSPVTTGESESEGENEE